MNEGVVESETQQIPAITLKKMPSGKLPLAILVYFALERATGSGASKILQIVWH